MPDAKPLSAEEMDALERDSLTGNLIPLVRRLFATVRDRERVATEIADDRMRIMAERDELQRQLEAVKLTRDGSHEICWNNDAKQAHEIARLQRQLSEAWKDTERLDWLMENRTSLWNSQYKNREAIDAARIAQGQVKT